MLPSATIGGKVNLYEPVHGSAPDIAGKGLANPLGAILTGALILRHSGGLEAEAAAIEASVRKVLEQGFRTPGPGAQQPARRRIHCSIDYRDGRKVRETVKTMLVNAGAPDCDRFVFVACIH
jgi:isocitrate dehydrogenase